MRRKIDYLYFLTVILLLIFGVVSVYSQTYFAGDYFLKRELFLLSGGIFILFLSMVLPLSFYKIVLFHWRQRPVNLIICLWALFFVLLLINVIIAQRTPGHIQRSITIPFLPPPFNKFQPQEFFKYAHLFFLAYLWEEDKPPIWFLILSLLSTACIFLQRAVGSAIIFYLSCLFLFLLMSLKTRYILTYLLIGLLFIPVGIKKTPHAEKRRTDWFQRLPEKIRFFKKIGDINFRNLDHQGYSKIGIASGRVFGRGLGQGGGKFWFLPKIHTDFIFSGICEELGFIGGNLLLILFFILLRRGFLIARTAYRCSKFLFLIAAGVSIILTLYALVHIFGAMDIIPCTGQPLPLVSYGGSALISNLWAMGTVLNISYITRKEF